MNLVFLPCVAASPLKSYFLALLHSTLFRPALFYMHKRPPKDIKPLAVKVPTGDVLCY